MKKDVNCTNAGVDRLVEIRITVHGVHGNISQKAYKVHQWASFSAIRKALRDSLNVQTIEITESDSDEPVDYDKALFSASSFSANRVPALTLKATVSDDEPSDVYKHMHVARILHRNALECLQAAENGTKPSNRKRHNSAESRPVDKKPRIDTFIHDTRELATTLKTFANTMAQMSSKLESSFENNDDAEQELRTMVENTMDAGRYFIPILSSLTKIALPKDQWDRAAELELEPVPVKPAGLRPSRHVVKGKAADAVDTFRTVL